MDMINLKASLCDTLFLMNSILHRALMHSRFVTSAVLRLECSLVCISGSVGHQQNIFRSFSHCQRFF